MNDGPSSTVLPSTTTVPPLDLTTFYITLNDIKRDVHDIKNTVNKTDENVVKIKEFIGYVEHPTEANPGMHEKFKALFDRVYKLEHFKTWSKTIGFAIVVAAAFLAKEYFQHQKDFLLHRLEHKTENKANSDLANK